jgi:deoxyadenosine/deoxycytidine kinase
LNERYEAWVSEYEVQYKKNSKLLIIDVDENNFSEKKEDLGKVITKLDSVINGLF